MVRAAIDLALALNPVVLAQRVGLEELDPWQETLLKSRAEQVIINCHRQAGKSSAAAIIALHQALFLPPALVLLLSPSLRQSSELFRKVRGFYNALGDAAPPAVQVSALSFELANGSRVVSLPGKEQTIRGFSDVALLVVDEASRVPDDLYQAVRPMLAVSGGQLVLLSTPFGKRGFFFHEWTEGIGWERVKVTADQCPRIDQEWLERERQAIGEWWFAQEYRCEFVESASQVFSYDHVMAALSPDIEALFGGVG